MAIRKFDLNIEKILEDWEACHAIREIIANALDERLLTQTKDIEIFQDKEKRWHIRDYGRGLLYEHLTQRENDEKLSNPHVIGKFGIGLKDALATFDRKGVSVRIQSKYGDITLGKSEKFDFEDVITLHAYVTEPSEPDFIGTEFILTGVTKKDISEAKNLFLIFSGDKMLEETKFGSVLSKKGKIARIYVNGVRVAEEDNFLFSYNITSLTSAIRKAMNRERTNVGRSAYTDRVKSILLTCETPKVAGPLMNNLREYQKGTLHEEVRWIDIQEHAVKILSSKTRVAFFTSEELMTAGDVINDAIYSGIEIVIVPEKLREKIRGQVDISGKPIRDLSQFVQELSESFEFKFIEEENLIEAEKQVFGIIDAIFNLIGGRPDKIEKISVSETMRRDTESFIEAEGLWIPSDKHIICKRTTLKSAAKFAGVLLHEVAHVNSGASDCSRVFEYELTRLLGLISSKSIRIE